MSGEVLYFAYGSNMLTARFEARIGKATKRDIGYLKGCKLTFDKKSKDESGKCNCARAVDDLQKGTKCQIRTTRTMNAPAIARRPVSRPAQYQNHFGKVAASAREQPRPKSHMVRDRPLTLVNNPRLNNRLALGQDEAYI
jgi:hypothetical protein